MTDYCVLPPDPSSLGALPPLPPQSPPMLVSRAISRVQVVLNREHRREKPTPFCLQWLGHAFSLQSPDGLNQGCCRGLTQHAC